MPVPVRPRLRTAVSPSKSRVGKAIRVGRLIEIALTCGTNKKSEPKLAF